MENRSAPASSRYANGGISARAALTFVLALAFAAGVSAQTLIEDFESTTWPSANWVLQNGAAGSSTSTAAAHDAARGWIGTGGWYRQTVVTIGDPNDRLSMWSRNGTGTARTYLGFAGSTTGCLSFVFASNTGDIRFQNNAGFGFAELSSAAFAATAGVWYRMEVQFAAGGNATGRIHASDGTTVLQTVNHAFGSIPVGNIILRSFGGHHSDTIQDTTPSGGGGGGGTEVPATSTTSLIVTALLLAGALGIYISRSGGSA